MEACFLKRTSVRFRVMKHRMDSYISEYGQPI